MSQERADLNWYHKPPDYFAGRSSSARDRAPSETQQAGTPQQARAGEDHDTEAGDFTFDDFLDIINPLQHLPGISMVYRAVTGDEISPHARIIGGGLYGGGTGFVAAIANAISEEASGRDLGDNLVAAVFGEDETAPTVADGSTESGGSGPSARSADTQGANLSQNPAVGAVAGAMVSPDAAAAAASAAVNPNAGTAFGLAANAKRDGGSQSTTSDQAPHQDRKPVGAAETLEGEAALAALFSDLQGRGGTVEMPVPTAAVGSPSNAEAPRPAPRAALQAASAPEPDPKTAPIGPRGGLVLDPSLFAGGVAKGQLPPGEAEAPHPFTGQMLHGLQKYEELMSRRQVSQADMDRRVR